MPRRLLIATLLVGCGPQPAAPQAAMPSSPRATLAVTRSAPVELSGGEQVEVVQIVTESIEPEGDYPGGSGVTVTLEVDGQPATLTLLSAGYTSQPIAWVEGLRVELVGIDGETASLAIDRITDVVLATEPVRIQRGETIRLFDQVRFTFISHGHKRVSGGQESPLMVNVDYHDGAAYGWTHSLYPPGDATWTWRDLRFALGAYDYDDFMELTVERLALSPEPAAILR